MINKFFLDLQKKCSMSQSFEIRFKEGDEFGHHLFVRLHSSRVEESTRPNGRTVLVTNIPPWVSDTTTKILFSRFGGIEDIQTQLKPGKAADSMADVNKQGKFTGLQQN